MNEKREVKLVNKINRLLRKANAPRFLHKYGPKKYELYLHMLALFIKQACKLSFRRASKLLRSLGFDVPSYSALCKMRKRMPFYLWKLLFSLTIPSNIIKVAAIDSTTLSRANPSLHYIKRIDRKNIIRCPVKLSSVIETRRKKILSLRIRSKNSHDVKDFKYLLNRIPNKILKLVGDTAYDSEKIHKYCYDKDIITIIKPRKNVKRGFYRKKMKKYYDEATYHRRSMIESYHTAYKYKYGSSLLGRTIDTQRAEVYCNAILYNLNLVY